MAVVDGVEVRFTNLDKVVYPAAGTTKADIVNYYLAVAPLLLPGLAGRPLTRKRWPGGVREPPFFAKDLDSGTPAWMTRVQITHSDGPKFYPLVDSRAGLAWLAQMNALELHVPQWRIEPTGVTRAPVAGRRAVRYPDRVVFDLDPGPGVGLAQCAQVAFAVRRRLGSLGERILPVTSGSKGLHLYVPMDDPITSQDASAWARQVAEQMEKELPDLVVSRMTKAIRAGKVLIDWSQNNAAKTTIAPYSLRGREFPTVAAPRSWDELADPGLGQLDYRQVLDRAASGLDPTNQPTGEPPEVALPRAVGESPRRRPAAKRSRVTPLRRVDATPPGAPAPAEPARGPEIPAATVSEWSPMLASPGNLELLTAGAVWRVENKWDGMRIIAALGHGAMVLRTRTGRDVTAGYPELAELPRLLGDRQVVLDGEIVAMDKTGRTDFGRLQQRIGLTRAADIDRIRRTIPVAVLLFDVLALDGISLLTRTLDERRRVLESLDIAGTFCMVPPQLAGDPAELLAQTKADGWEGIVAKRADSPYLPGKRSSAWVKIKNENDLEVAIIGWQPGQGRRADTIGSLLLAVPAEGGGWRYVGKVGTGMTDKMLADLTAVLAPLRQDAPAAAVPRPDARTAIWTTPALVGEVVYTETTHNGTLRAPRWRGLRSDKTISDLSAGK